MDTAAPGFNTTIVADTVVINKIGGREIDAIFGPETIQAVRFDGRVPSLLWIGQSALLPCNTKIGPRRLFGWLPGEHSDRKLILDGLTGVNETEVDLGGRDLRGIKSRNKVGKGPCATVTTKGHPSLRRVSCTELIVLGVRVGVEAHDTVAGMGSRNTL